MGRSVPMFALLAGITLSTFSATAQNGFSLKSVKVDLPTSDRTLPDGPGADKATICLACHSAGMVLNQPALSKAQWRAVVEKMRLAFRAPVDPKDVDAIVAYLVRVAGAG
jgi:hypothetical protein